jgi:hypothetical protein
MTESTLRIAKDMFDIFSHDENVWFDGEKEKEIQFEAELQYFYQSVHRPHPLNKKDYEAFFRTVEELDTLYCFILDEMKKLPKRQFRLALNMIREKITDDLISHYLEVCRAEEKNGDKKIADKMYRTIIGTLFSMWGKTRWFSKSSTFWL